MSDEQTVRFDNLRSHDVQLNVEPWAMSYSVPPDGVVKIDFTPQGDYQWEVATLQDGSVTIGVYASRISITLDGRVMFDFPGDRA
jgi:hypothetical protein